MTFNFIGTLSNDKEDALPVTTRRKISIGTSTSNKSPIENASPSNEGSLTSLYLAPTSKYPTQTPRTLPPSVIIKSATPDKFISKNVVISDRIEYNIIEDMKNTKANISLYEVSKLKQQ